MDLSVILNFILILLFVVQIVLKRKQNETDGLLLRRIEQILSVDFIGKTPSIDEAMRICRKTKGKFSFGILMALKTVKREIARREYNKTKDKEK